MVLAELGSDAELAAQFWQFSLRLYPRLQTSLLALQDQYHCHINILLLSAWRPALPPVATIVQAVSSYHSLTSQIRQLRREIGRQSLQSPADSLLPNLKQQLLEAELTAERLEQQALVVCLQDPTHVLQSADTFRMQYLTSCHVPAAVQQQLAVDLDQALLQLGLS